MLDLVGNLEARVSRVSAQMVECVGNDYIILFTVIYMSVRNEAFKPCIFELSAHNGRILWDSSVPLRLRGKNTPSCYDHLTLNVFLVNNVPSKYYCTNIFVC